jgi:uncharacterized membrane-anchored protein
MNLLNKCTKGEIELIEKAGITLMDKDYTEEELKKCGNEIIDYIMAHSTKNGDIDKLRNQYSSIFRTIGVK